MDTNNSRGLTDPAIFKAFFPSYAATIAPERKIAAFDQIMYLVMSEAVKDGTVRTENIAEIGAAFEICGELVQASGYDIIDAMKKCTEYKSTGTRSNTKAKQAKWVKHTAQVKLSKAKAASDYFMITVSLNSTISSTAVHYLIPKEALLNTQKVLRSQIDFKYGETYGENGPIVSVDTRCPFYQYMFRDFNELADRYAALPKMVEIDSGLFTETEKSKPISSPTKSELTFVDSQMFM